MTRDQTAARRLPSFTPPPARGQPTASSKSIHGTRCSSAPAAARPPLIGPGMPFTHHQERDRGAVDPPFGEGSTVSVDAVRNHADSGCRQQNSAQRPFGTPGRDELCTAFCGKKFRCVKSSQPYCLDAVSLAPQRQRVAVDHPDDAARAVLNLDRPQCRQRGIRGRRDQCKTNRKQRHDKPEMGLERPPAAFGRWQPHVPAWRPAIVPAERRHGRSRRPLHQGPTYCVSMKPMASGSGPCPTVITSWRMIRAIIAQSAVVKVSGRRMSISTARILSVCGRGSGSA